MAGQKEKTLNRGGKHAENSAGRDNVLSHGANGFSEFAEFLLRNEESGPSTPDFSLSRELALAAIENLGEGEVLEKDADLRLIAFRRELDSWLKEIRALGKRESFFPKTGSSSASYSCKRKTVFADYPRLPAAEILDVDYLTGGFKKGFAVEKEGQICRDPDLHAAVEGVFANPYTPFLREELKKIEVPSYLQRAFCYIDDYRAFWEKELARREKEMGSPEEIRRKIHPKVLELEERESKGKRIDNFRRFLEPFYSHEEEKTWPWASHVRDDSGDLSEVMGNDLLQFGLDEPNAPWAIYPLRKAGGRYLFLVFVPDDSADDKTYDFSYKETLSMDKNGKLLNPPPTEGFSGNWSHSNPPVSAHDWGKQIEGECPSLFEALEPFPGGEKLHELDSQEALEYGLSNVTILLKGSSPMGYFPLLNDKRLCFDDYGEIFYLMHKPPEKSKSLWRETGKEAKEKVACTREVKIESKIRCAFLIQVKEENIGKFYRSYYEALLEEEEQE